MTTPEEYRQQRLAQRAATYRDRVTQLRALVRDEPKPDEACDRCGLHATACQCDQPTRRPAQRLDPDAVRAKVAVLRHNVVPLRAPSNRPDPTDPQPEEPA